MRLKEFIDKNGKQIKIPKSSNAPKNTGNNLPPIGSFKERFKELIEYTSKHKNPNTKNITTETLADDKLEFTEHYYDGSSVSYEIYIGPLTEAWRFKVYTDGDFSHPIDDMSGMEWVELLKQLRYYIVLPVVGTPEYKELLAENLKEFVDKNGNKINLNNPSSNIPSKAAVKNNLDQTERYKKLLAKIDSEKKLKYELKDLTNRILALVINFSADDRQYIRILFSPKNGTYLVQIVGDNDFRCSSWDEVLQILISIGVIRNTYNCESIESSEENILTEFVDKNGNKISLNKTSSGASTKTANYYKRLRKLLNYHIDHKDDDVDKILQNDVSPYGFTYREQKFKGGYTRGIIANIDQDENWTFQIFFDNKELKKQSGKGWDTFVWEISFYLNLPEVTTDPEYQDLLEFVDKTGNKVNLPKNSPNATTAGKTSSKTNKERFKELVAYMDKYKDIYTVKTEAEWIKDTGFKYVITRKSPGVKEYTMTLELTHSRFNSSWQFETYRNYDYVEDYTGQGWKELLKALSRSEFGLYTTIPASGSNEYDYLCESTSFADDFKAYENLWD